MLTSYAVISVYVPCWCMCPGVMVGETCYYLLESNAYKTWKDAAWSCQQAPTKSHLAVPNTDHINDALKQLMIKHQTRSIWLGGYDSLSEWKWVPGRLYFSPK